MKSSGRISFQRSTTSFDLEKKTVAANIKAKALMFHCPADPAHISRIFLNYRDTIAPLREQIGSRKTCRTCADDGDIYSLFSTRHSGIPLAGWLHPKGVNEIF